MKLAIIGFPGSGKTTVFKAVTDYSAGGRGAEDLTKPLLGTVKIKDERLNKLAEIFQPKKITPEEFVFNDLPGFNLSQIKNVETIIHVIGVFSGRDYKKDINDMEIEFMISDLAIIEKKLESLEKELKSKPSPDKELERSALRKAKEALDKNAPVRSVSFTKDEDKALGGYQFLSKKPVCVVANLNEAQVASGLGHEIEVYGKEHGVAVISICASVEAEIKELDPSERVAFAKELGITEFCADKVVKTARDLAGLMCFFTGSYKGEEVRAWPVPRGSTAPQAAGKIHTDFERGFIRAEIVAYDDFIKYGSFAEAKTKGVLRLEGKEYIVKDGDIITFHFNV
ncbi:MAG: DUF933 domain-containing protein [Candidatus Omnitrophica bacterium]|nr:DUF933 domain-containing protein [Candidatus Omnitrophota bacterium]